MPTYRARMLASVLVAALGASHCGGNGSGMPSPAVCTLLRPDPWVMQPQSTSVAAGQSAVFSVTLSNAFPVSLQWARDGLYITGATAATYVTAPATSADNGAIFVVFATVTYPAPCAGSQTYQSAAAVLTVQ